MTEGENKREKERETGTGYIHARRGTASLSLLPDNRQLEERGGCRGG